MAKKYTFEPDYAHAIAPGVSLKETLEAKGISQADLSTRTGLAKKTISQIVNGVAPITLDTADRLELALGVPARFWNKRELTYREALAKVESAKQLSEDAKWLKEIPVQELVRRGFIVASDDKADVIRQALRFFGVSSVDAWRDTWTAPCVQFRGASVQKRHPGKVAAWLRHGELKAERIECEPYDAQRFRENLYEIRRYADKPASEWYPAMVRLCAEAGVAVVFVRAVPGASVSGATKWLNKDKAVIMLSLKYKTDDHVWFSFFHESAHVYKHGKKLVFIEDDDSPKDELEVEADTLARNMLVPQVRAHQLAKLRGRVEIRAFARSIGVSPGIVVGRLQRDGHLGHQMCHDLKVKLEWPPEETPGK